MAQNGHSSDFKIGWEKGWEAGWRAAIEFGRSSSATSLGLPPQSALGLPQLAEKDPQPCSTPPPQEDRGQQRRKGSDRSETRCTLCKGFHPEPRHACPRISDFRSGKHPPPQDICLLCLSLLDSQLSCSNIRQPCHKLKTQKGVEFSLVCQIHEPKKHFQLCGLCDPEATRSMSGQMAASKLNKR